MKGSSSKNDDGCFEVRAFRNPFVLILVGMAGVIVARVCAVYEPAALAVGITAVGWAPIMWILCVVARERFFRSFLTIASLLSVVAVLLPLACAAPHDLAVNEDLPWILHQRVQEWFFVGGFGLMWMMLLWLAIRGRRLLRLCSGACGATIGWVAPRAILVFLLDGTTVLKGYAPLELCVEMLAMYVVPLAVVAVGRFAILCLLSLRKEELASSVAAHPGEGTSELRLTKDLQLDDQRRRPYQFSLQTILAVVVIVALACGWLVTKRSQFRTQREAIEVLGEPGSRVEYVGDVWLNNKSAAYPRSIYWCAELLPIEAYGNASVVLIGKDVNDGDLEHLTRLAPANVIELRIEEASITDDGMRHLARLDALNDLEIRDTPVTDHGLKHLGQLRRLRTLCLINSNVRGSTLASLRDCPLFGVYLGGSPIGDDALAHLSHLNGLECLGLEQTKITDEGLRHLGKMDELSSLSVSSTRITDAGLRHLTAMRNLSSLDISDTDVTDEGLRELGRMRNLYSLYLSSTRITDRGLRHLKSLRNLKYLRLKNTRVSGTGLAHLASLQSLRELYLDESDIDDSDLRHLSRLPELQTLSLRNTAIGDAAVVHLMSLPPDVSVDLHGTRITERGIKQLGEASIRVCQ